MEDIEKALEEAIKPGKVICPECGEELFSPIDKLSISLFGFCPDHLSDLNAEKLIKIAENL